MALLVTVATWIGLAIARGYYLHIQLGDPPGMAVATSLGNGVVILSSGLVGWSVARRLNPNAATSQSHVVIGYLLLALVVGIGMGLSVGMFTE